MSLFFLKIIITVLVVLALSHIAEKVSPKWAGLLGGFPLGAAIVLGFIAHEEGLVFAAASTVHTVAGLGASIALVGTYGMVLIMRPQWNVIVVSLVSFMIFLLIGSILSQIDFNLITAYIFILLCMMSSIWAFRTFPESIIENQIKLKAWVPLVRGLSAAFCVVIITGLANELGEEASGVLAGFPLTLFPLLIIIHVSYGPRPVITIVKNFPKGLGALLLFCAFFSLFLEKLGLAAGLMGAFAIATVYIAAYGFFQHKMRPQANE